MSFIQRELDRIGDALRPPQSGDQYYELYANASMGKLEPDGFKSPYGMLVPVMDTPEGSGDCQGGSGRSQFSGNPDHRAS
jgi:hypothetical protein